MEPTTIPLILSRHPLRFKFIIIRSIWYKYSSKSSINKILSEQSIADGEPNKLYKIDRFQTNSPEAVLFFPKGGTVWKVFLKTMPFAVFQWLCVVALGAVIGIIP
jgi:hypothetical protein